MIQMARGYVVSRIIYAAAKIGLADQLADSPKSAEEIAGHLGAHPPSLHRLMRALASLGILTERGEQRYALTSLGATLTTGAPGSAKSSVLTFCSPYFQNALDHIVYSIQTGKTGFEKAHGIPLFDYLALHPEEASLFNEAMAGANSLEPPAVAAAYDFSVFKTIIDVGGATGNLLAEILTRHARPRGVLFDRPHIVADAPALLKTKGLSDRVRIEAGDFFKTVPEGGDAYVLSHVIHDWSEDQCLTILGHIRNAMK